MSTPSSSTELHDLGVVELAAKLATREISSVEVTQHFLKRIAKYDSLGAFLATDSDVSLAQAKAADARLAAGERTPLLGVPLAHKDVFVTRDFVTTAGSKMLENYRSPFDATVVAKLAAAGMVTLGKLNCDEFAMGSGNDNSAYKPAHNPWDTTRVPGGSAGACGHGHRHGRLDSPAGITDRYHWNQTDLRPLLTLWHGGVCVQPGSGRAHGPQRTRLRAATVRHGRAGFRPRLDIAGHASA
jgi:hypothetical protein